MGATNMSLFWSNTIGPILLDLQNDEVIAPFSRLLCKGQSPYAVDY